MPALVAIVLLVSDFSQQIQEAVIASSAIALYILLHHLVGRPLCRLLKIVKRAEKNGFLVRAPLETQDEIGQLATVFNSMVTRITAMKVTEIETSREIESIQRQLDLQVELEKQRGIVEQTNRALAHRVKEMSLLLEIATSLNSTLALPEILSRVTEMVAVSMGVDQFTVMLLDDNNQELQVVTSFGYRKEELTGYRLGVDTGACGLAATSRETIYISDLMNDSRYFRSHLDPVTGGSLVCMPMICREKLVGILNFMRFSKNAFSENDIVLLQLVGNQAAMSIMNAQLYSDTLEMAMLDPLTGLFNRRHLYSSLDTEIARAERAANSVSVLLIDVDHFKRINDSFGHLIGDAVLKTIAAIFQSSVRKTDTVVRFGGEEFLIILPKNPSEASHIGEKIRLLVENTDFEKHATASHIGRITISLGIASFPEHGGSVEQLLSAADSALFHSKRTGRNKFTIYSHGMDLHPNRRRHFSSSSLISNPENDPEGSYPSCDDQLTLKSC